MTAVAKPTKRPKKIDALEAAIDAFVPVACRAGMAMDQAQNFIKVGVFLQPKQIQFCVAARLCDRDGGPKSILSGGGRGSAKSHAVFAQIFCDDCQRVPGLKCLFLRKVGGANKEQVSDFIRKLLISIPHKYRESAPAKVEFPNGSFVILGNFKDEKDIDKYLGLEYDLIYIMESNQLTQTKKMNVLSCLRTNKTNWRPRCYQDTNPGGIDHVCVPHGEVLTPAGWVDIREIQVGEFIYSLLPSGSMVPIQVSETHKNQYSGKLISVDVRGLTMVCTPYHRVAKRGGIRLGKNTRYKISDRFSLVPFQNLAGQVTILRSIRFCGGKEIKSFTVPDTRKQTRKGHQARVPKTITGRQYCELMGWFLSEGCATSRGAGNFRWTISQIKEPQRTRIRELLSECGFGFRETKSSFDLCGIEWWTYLNQFGKCREKFVPNCIKNCSLEEMWSFFIAFMDGDGHWSKRLKSGHAYSISKKLADDICEIALKLGFVVSLTMRMIPDRNGPIYSVDFKTVKSGGTELLTGKHIYDVKTKTKRSSDIQEIDFDGMVYCLTVPQTENFIIRQKGSIWISGNCNKRLFVDPWKLELAGGPKQTETRYIHSTVDDNAYVDKGYKEYLEKLVGWQRAAWLDGSWEFMAGAFFSNFHPDTHVYPNAQTDLAPRTITRWFAGLDYGFSHPNAFVLCCETEDGDIFVTNTYSASSTLIEEHAANIFDVLRLWNLEPGDLEFIAAGKDCFRVDKDGSTVATEYQAHGIELVPVHIDRINAWSQVAELFGDPMHQIRPRCFIHRNCAELILQIQSSQSDPSRPNDVLKMNANPEDGTGGDDLIESFRNSCVMAYSSLLKNAKPMRLGGYQPLIGNDGVSDGYIPVESVMAEAERNEEERRADFGM